VQLGPEWGFSGLSTRETSPQSPMVPVGEKDDATSVRAALGAVRHKANRIAIEYLKATHPLRVMAGSEYKSDSFTFWQCGFHLRSLHDFESQVVQGSQLGEKVLILK
jgi:hypothetical protein